jgi:hypothetical protein
MIRSTRNVAPSLSRPAQFVKPTERLVLAAGARTGATGRAGTPTRHRTGVPIAALPQRRKPGDRPPGTLVLTLRAVHGRIRLAHTTQHLEFAFATIAHVFIERHATHLDRDHTRSALPARQLAPEAVQSVPDHILPRGEGMVKDDGVRLLNRSEQMRIDTCLSVVFHIPNGL